MLKKNTGNTIPEYLLMFGLVVVVAVVALNMLGVSIFDLLNGKVASAMGSGGAGGGVMSILAPVPKTGSLALSRQNAGKDGKGGEKYGTAKAGTNATSVEGDNKSEKSFASAIFMESLIAEDPANADTLRKMTQLLYRMGGVEGAYLESGGDRDTSMVVQSNGGYTKESAHYDLQKMQRRLLRLMGDLPMSSPAYGAAQSLVADANLIAESFNGNREYSKPAGTDSDYSVWADLDFLQTKAEQKLKDNFRNNRHEGTFDDALKSDIDDR